MRRLSALLCIALCSVSVLAQRRDGVWAKTPWSINEHHTLIWGGQPYLPVGIHVEGTPSTITGAHEAGIRDLIVDLPAGGAGWQEALQALQTTGQRYLLRVNSMAPTARGFVVEPQSYRITGIDEPRKFEIPLPGATSAFVILASKRDGSIDKKDRVPVINGKLVYEAKPGPAIEHILLIYPETVSADQPDFWENLDGHRDALLSSLKRFPPGEGLRGLINPMGRLVELPGREPHFVPTSTYFRMELARHLEQRYRSLQTAQRSWSVGGADFTTFDDLARLVPLWSAERGVGFMLDPKTNKLYPVDRRLTNAWADIAQVISVASVRRFDRLVAAVRSVVDVPVVQEWAGWASPYEAAQPAIDGVGMLVSGVTPSDIAESACRPVSSILRWKTRGWLIATDVDLGSAASADQVSLVADDLAAIGARGFFFRSGAAPHVAAIVQEALRKAADAALPTLSPTALFYPENATNPANPQRISGGKWWLPTPADGNRLDLGREFYGYRFADRIALWARTPGRYKLRMSDPKKGKFESVDGSDPAPKQVKGGVEVNLTQFPLIITDTAEVPIPEAAYLETATDFDEMMKVAESGYKDIVEERIMFKEQINGFERNPGGAFPELRKTLYRLAYKVGNYVWIEAERSTNTNFSEGAAYPGASAAGALVLNARIDPGPEGFFTEYQIPVRSPDEQTVWIAARIPKERRGQVMVFVGGQAMQIPDEPVAAYGQGLAWYKLGATRLAGNTSTLRVQTPGLGPPIAIDVILITPGGFQPNAVMPPIPVNR